MIHDTCDYCRREFGRFPGEPAICLNCGCDNVREISAPPAARRETAVFKRPRATRAMTTRRKKKSQ